MSEAFQRMSAIQTRLTLLLVERHISSSVRSVNATETCLLLFLFGFCRVFLKGLISLLHVEENMRFFHQPDFKKPVVNAGLDSNSLLMCFYTAPSVTAFLCVFLMCQSVTLFSSAAS